MIAQLDELTAVRCPCGFARRAFAGPDNPAATVHLVDIQEDSRAHYHKAMTELYIVLKGEGHLELDGRLFPVRPMTAVLIKPGCRHRAVGQLQLINIPIPAFNATDEWFEEPNAAT